MTASHVYDKAKYHYDGDFPDELPIEQGFVHTGMFLGWVIDNDLYSEFLYTEASGYIESFKQRELTGAQVYEYACDGTFIDDMLTEAGNRFARDYFDFDKGSYLIDYDLTLTCNLPTLYHAENSWENYEKLRKVIDKRYAEWKAKNRINN